MSVIKTDRVTEEMPDDRRRHPGLFGTAVKFIGRNNMKAGHFQADKSLFDMPSQWRLRRSVRSKDKEIRVQNSFVEAQLQFEQTQVAGGQMEGYKGNPKIWQGWTRRWARTRERFHRGSDQTKYYE